MKEFPTLTNSRPEFREFKKKFNPYLTNLAAPHVESFNSMLRCGLTDVAKYMQTCQFMTSVGEKILLKIIEIRVDKPHVPKDCIGCKTNLVYPMECRQSSRSYSGQLHIRLAWNVNEFEKEPIDIDLGEVPIMLKTDACNLNNLTSERLVSKGEHETEWGGYFVIKGNEKIIRMLLMTRRNYPIAIKRSTWKDRGNFFTDIGIMVRTVRSDEQSFTNVLHYLNNGTAKFMFSQMKNLLYIPVCLLLKCLVSYTDELIYAKLIKGYENDQYYQSSIQNMLREVHEEGLHTQNECKNYLGELFRVKFPELPEWSKNSEFTEFIFKERILIHLEDNIEKFNFIVFMVQKLFQCAQDQNKMENVDGVMMQEVLLSGHLYQKFLNDRLDLWLSYLKKNILKKCNQSDILLNSTIIQQAAKNCGGLGHALESFLATGNAPSRSGMNLMQNTGLVVMAENINRMRYMSHFRAVHRGSFFVTMRTTEARQLLPDAWGFICPVHTPDGTPCGLLNHLTVNCKISDRPDDKLVKKIPKSLMKLGMISIESDFILEKESKTFVVMLEGKILGYIRQSDALKIIDELRYLKIENEIPNMLEIGYVPYRKKGQYPGLYLFVGPSRMMRPVRNLKFNKIEYIGSFEQIYMDIAIDEKEKYPGITTHMELSKTDFLSNLALLIPMPDCNQSPRNMYQCQMGKQTMGTPCHNWSVQASSKLYRLQTPHTPLFRPVHHDNIDLDDFAMGTNAVVAVISYTGYDMEDAMIINKAACERGLSFGEIYKSHFVELRGSSYFARDPHNEKLIEYLDNDGLPYPGRKIEHKSILYCYFDADESIYKIAKNHETENAVIDNIKFIGNFKASAPKMICITIRIPRPPTIGDKFASRAGQKGICSQTYPAEDLPFTETGLIPDIIFNPHGFPSRMTIAMMIETMAGKSASLHGLVHDATPFRFTEKHTAIDHFGKLLEQGGYNYYGTERLYSGVDGREMTADIFFGVVHYQRLRHMVFDKYQVRSTGTVDAITHQPIKGRKRGGGVRFGEMERDGLISHGAAYLLQDRLFHCSDRSLTLACSKCGSILAPMDNIKKRSEDGSVTSISAICRICNDESHIRYIDIPYSYKYLVTELSSVNINAKFKFTTI